jgi:1,4-alpha-glucan branching enzyme
MLDTQPGDNGRVVVTFRLPHAAADAKVCVVGEFNDWSETADPMEHDGEGFVAHISLAPGRTYRFRYLLDGVRWENDWEADAYVPNEFGGDDSVLDLTGASRRDATRQRPTP